MAHQLYACFVGSLADGYHLMGIGEDPGQFADPSEISYTKEVIPLVTPLEWVKDTLGDYVDDDVTSSVAQAEAIATERGTIVVASGDAFDGLSFIGPFVDHEDALWVGQNFASDHWHTLEVSE